MKEERDGKSDKGRRYVSVSIDVGLAERAYKHVGTRGYTSLADIAHDALRHFLDELGDQDKGRGGGSVGGVGHR